MNLLRPVKIVLAGIGGYGAHYVRELLKGEGEYPYEWVGAVDPYPANSPFLVELAARSIPVYDSLDRFYESADADLAIISSPIQYHGPQTCLALSHGSHVLLEKPLCARMEDARRMIEARDRAHKFVAVGYQWSYSSAMQALKRDIASGLFGKPKRFRTLVLWPRSERYYSRGWAGKLRDDRGNMILDSVANNAAAHYIHNMFFVLGRGEGASALPVRVKAELYRANRIENYDTAAMRAYTEDGVELLYYGSHAVRDTLGALFRYEFEQADVIYDDNARSGAIVARFHSGETMAYGNPNRNGDSAKLQAALAAAHGGGPVACGLEAALSQTICINMMQQSSPDIVPFPETIVRRGAVMEGGETGNYVEDLVEQLKRCYDKGELPAESGIPWARAGREVEVTND
ncbi:Gfo/Idh/MocA family protein [Cohnella fermenti]|uniref:Gfo/Idh/MocA family oxidoreductase n=1 Tax=Cohnella fermenti TaxID=2565925 RepID=A0A4S4BPC7_9BACL|nr:Gfo/Idh/MocA family oxidoreductase [Cohnella fermenti]THF76713.1 Gfo/Idh/MocA family oxidoreductase [Cohnella fermenti]